MPFITANAVNAQVAYEVQYVGAEYGIGNVDVINCIQSKNGNIWVATKNQLYRFNGLTTQIIGRTSENTSLNIPDNHVQSIAEDQEGYIWVCTLNGPTVIDPVHHKNIDLAAQVPALQSLFSDVHAVYNGENNAVFFMTTHDIYLYRDKTVTHICAIGTSSDNYTVDLCYHPKEKKLYFMDRNHANFVVENARVRSLDGDVKMNFKNDTYPLSATRYFRFPFLADTMVNLLWSEVLYKTVKQNGKTLYFTRKINETFFPPFSAALQYVQQDPRSFSQGMVKNMNLQCAIPLSTPGQWCIGTPHGVFLVKEKKQLFHHVKETRGYSSRGIYERPDKSLWIGTYTGLVQLHRNQTTIKNTYDYANIWDFWPVTNDSIWIVGEVTNSLRLITNPGKPRQSIYTPPFSHHFRFCKSFALTPGGGAWLSTQTNVLIYFEPHNNTYQFFYGTDTLQRGLVRKMHYSTRSGLWQGGFDGLKQYPTDINGKLSGAFTSKQLPPVFATLDVNAIYEDNQGLIWVGTSNKGLFVYDPTQQNIKEHWTVNNGLPHNTVYSILSSQHDSVLWLGTQNGICRLEKYNKMLHNYYATDGLGQDEFNTGSSFQSKDGTCYFGGIDGISSFNLEKITPSILKNDGYIELEITSKTSQLRRNLVVYPGQSVDIAANEIMLDITFHSNDVFQAKKQLCRYRIGGIHSEWRVINLPEKLILAGLKPGDYSLEYQIRPLHSGWSDTATAHFCVLPHWYQSTWFYTLLSIVLASLLYAFYRWRIMQLREAYEFRKSVTDDLHDTLGTRLYLLKVLAAKIIQQKNNVNPELLQKFEEQTKDALQSVRSFIWAFDPKNDTLEALYNRLTDFAENYMHPIVRDFHLQINPVNKDQRITPKMKHHILQIYQETLTNIVKHTFVEKIEIKTSFNLPEKTLYIEVHNTHAGLKTEESSDHQYKGKQSMQERAAEIKAAMEWTEPEPGKQITRLQIPMHDTAVNATP